MKFEELEGALLSARAAKKELARMKALLGQANAALEREKVTLQEERDEAVSTLQREGKRLRDSRIQEVTRERVKLQTAMVDKAYRWFGKAREYLAQQGLSEKAKNFSAKQ